MTASDRCSNQIKKDLLCRSHPHRSFAAGTSPRPSAAIVAIEGAAGTDHNDEIWGDFTANILMGAGGNDVLVGGGGSDTMDGGAGNDTISAGVNIPVLVKEEGHIIRFTESAPLLDTLFTDLEVPGIETVGIPHATVRARSAGERELFGVTVEAGETVTFDIDNVTPGIDLRLVLFTANGLSVMASETGDALSDGGEGLDPRLVHEFLEAGTYYIEVQEIRENNDDGFRPDKGIDYTLNVSVPSAQVTTLQDGSVLMGGAGSDLITDSVGDDEIMGGIGSDWINIRGGNDIVDGGAGNDMVSFASLAETDGRTNADYRLDIDLTAGTATSFDDEQEFRLAGVERITATIFADRIKGDEGNNQLRGLGDYDWFIATKGNDTIDGGNGLDMISFQDYDSTQASLVSDVFSTNGATPTGAQISGVLVDLNNASNNTGLAAGQSMTSIERVTGSSWQDVFVGDSGENDFRGLGGYDWFVSSGGGRERYFGGDGLDTVTYALATAGVTASLRNGATLNGLETGYGSRGEAARDLYFEIENFVGSQHGDYLAGSEQRNQINGLGGDDFIFGYGGVDYLMGGAGNDTINGGAGSDFAIFNGNSSDYTLVRNGNEVSVSGNDGSDLLINVEYFQFDDAELNIWSL